MDERGGVKQGQYSKTFLGLPVQLSWGFLAVLLFMVGDGVEQAFLSKYIVQLGFSVSQSAFVFTIYGIAVAAASWLSGVLVDVWGARKTMALGLVVWVVFDIAFLTLGLSAHNYPLMVLTYGLRGFGYPLYSYAFIVWIAYVTPKSKLSSAMGWFWVVFDGGMQFIGSYYPSFVLPHIGYMPTLWTSLIWIVIGGLAGIFLIREDSTVQNDAIEGRKMFLGLVKGLTILYENPRVLAGGIVKTINNTGKYGFAVIMPIFFTQTVGFTVSQWLLIWGTLGLANTICNFLWGFVGDKIGWRRQVAWCGGVGCAVTTLLFYYVPYAAGNQLFIAMVVAVLYAITVAAYVPIGAIMPSLEPRNKGAAMSILNLGSGLSSFVGPAIVALLVGVIHTAGVIWTFAILYLIGAGLTYFLDVNKVPASKLELEEVVEPNAH